MKIEKKTCGGGGGFLYIKQTLSELYGSVNPINSILKKWKCLRFLE